MAKNKDLQSRPLKASFGCTKNEKRKKSGFPSLEKTKNLVLLSVERNDKCTGKHLVATVAESLRMHEAKDEAKDEVLTTFLIADEVNWHNQRPLESFPTLSDDDKKNLQEKALELGDTYFKTNRVAFLKPLGHTVESFEELCKEVGGDDLPVDEQINIINKLALKLNKKFEIVRWGSWVARDKDTCCAQLMSENPSEVARKEVTDKTKILFIKLKQFEIGYCSDNGEYTQKIIEDEALIEILRRYNAGENIHDAEDLLKIDAYLTSKGISTHKYKLSESVSSYYDSNEALKKSIDQAASDFAASHALTPEELPLWKSRSRAYLKEESPAIVCLGARLGYNFIVYPGKEPLPFIATRNHFILQDNSANNPWLPSHSEEEKYKTPSHMVNWLNITFTPMPTAPVRTSPERRDPGFFSTKKAGPAALLRGMAIGVIESTVPREEQVSHVQKILNAAPNTEIRINIVATIISNRQNEEYLLKNIMAATFLNTPDKEKGYFSKRITAVIMESKRSFEEKGYLVQCLLDVISLKTQTPVAANDEICASSEQSMMQP